MRVRERPKEYMDMTAESYSTTVNPYKRYPSQFGYLRWQVYASAIADEVGRQGKYKSCAQHSWQGWVNTQPYTYAYNATGDNTTWVPAHWLEVYASGAHWRPDGMLQPLAALVGDVSYKHYERWLRVKPTLATRANLFVFLAELRDIKRMVDILPPRHFHAKNWRDVAKWANGQHLNFNFGVKPFCRDLVNSMRAIDSFEARLSKFIANADRDLNRHAADIAKDLQSVVEVPLTSGCAVKCTLEVREVKRVSTFLYRYVIPYNDADLRWRAWIDSLGLAPSLSNIYELIPLSFVADWFWDFGGALKSRESDWLEPIIKWLHAGYSMKYSGTSKVEFRGPTAYGNGWTPCSSVRLDSYQRAPGYPVFSGTTDSLDADKIRLGSSLIAGRVL